jgi:uncharacterized protein YndB with AHSA1/START domain
VRRRLLLVEFKSEDRSTTMMSSAPVVLGLPGDEQILLSRVFRAPRQLVYRAWTTPELVKRWWAGGCGQLIEAEIDLLVGGWRYVLQMPDGRRVVFGGVYRRIEANERIVATEVFDGVPDGQALDTITFAERGGLTTVTLLIEYASRAARDAHLASGMEHGRHDALHLLECAPDDLGPDDAGAAAVRSDGWR